MVNNEINNRCSTLFWLLLFVPIIASGELVTDLKATDTSLPGLIYDSSEHFSDITTANLDGLLKRIADSRVVVLGESSHGTYEFYEMRARITKALIESKGFNIIAVEADWPDASRIDYYIRHSGRGAGNGENKSPLYQNKPFAVFPEWMWRNHSVLAFTRWLKNFNRSFDSAEDAVGFYGIDIYNLFGSIEVVLDYLQQVNPRMANLASRHYSCLFPYAHDPSSYGRAVKLENARVCKDEVSAVLQDLLNKREFFERRDKQRFFSILQNAQLVKNGEHYFRTMRDDDTDAWNQRDGNMFERLQAILDFRGKTSKAVVWAHNIHIGDARATDMRERGEINLGQRIRLAYGNSAYIIGFGTDHGTVAAAPGWDRPVEVQTVPPSHKDSYEYLFHQVKADNFLLPLRYPEQQQVREKLMTARVARAIGVAYDPKNELKKHYYSAILPQQFDEYIFFDESRAVRPLSE